MKAIKKWLMDKEGVFIVITWWVILFIVFSIILGTSIGNVVKNSEITAETSTTYIQDFITKGDVTFPYNENIKKASAAPTENEYLIKIDEYHNVLTKEYTGKTIIGGDTSVNADVKLDLEVIEVYSVVYNYTNKKATIDLVSVKTENSSKFDASIKTTPSGELHILWNGVDTGVVYTNGQNIEISRSGDKLVINGEKLDVDFYNTSVQAEFIEEKDKEEAKTIDFSLVVEYEIGVNNFTTANYKTDGLNDTEKAVVEVAVNYFTELLEGSIGISKSAFTLLIVSSVVDVLLLGFGVFGIVALKKSKEE